MNVPSLLLGLIAKESAYGYDLKKEYDYLFAGNKPIAYGQVYSSLARLARDKKVIVSDEISDEGPDRKKYSITELGRKQIDDWLSKPENPHINLQVELLTKVILAIILQKDAEKYLNIQKRTHIERMREILKDRKNKNLQYKLLSDYVIAHLEADVKWIDLTLDRLDILKEELFS